MTNEPTTTSIRVGPAPRLGLFVTRDQVVVPPRGVAILSGAAGVGKTQIAASVFYQLTWRVGIWVDASERSAAVQGLVSAAGALGIPSPPTPRASTRALGTPPQLLALLGFLRRSPVPWVVVFDGADDLAVLAGLVPEGDGGLVLVTTRHPPDPVLLPQAVAIVVESFSEREASTFLGASGVDDRSRYVRLRPVDRVRLIEGLDAHPHALALARSYLAHTNTDPRTYLDLVAAQPGPSRLAALGLSLRAAGAAAPMAAPLAQLAAAVGPAYVPMSLITSAETRARLSLAMGGSGGSSTSTLGLVESDVSSTTIGRAAETLSRFHLTQPTLGAGIAVNRDLVDVILPRAGDRRSPTSSPMSSYGGNAAAAVRMAMTAGIVTWDPDAANTPEVVTDEPATSSLPLLIPVQLDLRPRRITVDVTESGSAEWLTPDQALVHGSEYEVWVQVTADRSSPLQASMSYFDEFFNTREDRIIRVSLLTRDLEVIGPSTHDLPVPAYGPSPAWAFEVRTPPEGKRFAARISFLHGNNLLQSFSLTGDLVGAAAPPTGRLEVHKDHDSGGLAHLDQVMPRDLALVVNTLDRDHYVFTHTESGDDLRPLTATATWDLVQKLRTVLGSVIDIDAAIDDSQLDTTIRELAGHGADLHTALFNSEELGHLQEDLIALAQLERPAFIQVNRLDVNQALPWPLVYDWPLPEDLSTLEVCRTDACGHTAATVGQRVCVQGFWGLRNYVEETYGRIGRPPSGQDGSAVSFADQRSALLSVGLQPGRIVSTLQEKLEALAKPGSLALPGSSDELLDLLWDDEARPAVAILVGHHARREAAGRRASDYMIAAPGRGEFSVHGLAQRAKVPGHTRWGWPGPITLLLGCATAASKPTDLTGLVQSLSAVHALAVIGTECDIRTSQAAAIAQTMLEQLRGDAPSFAEAVRTTRRRLLFTEGNACGFALTALGPDFRITWV